MAVLDQIQPKEVFRFFEEMSRIPHGTFDTKRISDYCVEFAKERNLDYTQDSVNNVIIRKPGTEGYEDSEPVIIQGHLDMVCEKRPGSSHDFSKDPLEIFVEDGFVKAKDTTLGGDDCIAVAMALAVLDSKEIPHPPIEAVFTVDEEVGMGGANAIDLDSLKGKRLLNIDSDTEGILTSGCAGGYRYDTAIPVTREKKSGTLVEIKVHGLLGGHSGAEIHKQRGNAHKMMGRLLNRISLEVPFHLLSICGGAKDNVIAMDSTAKLIVDAKDADRVCKIAEEMKKTWEYEFMGDEPSLAVDTEAKEGESADVCDEDSTRRVISYLTICPNGVQGFARKLENLVETSLSLGVIVTEDTCIRTCSLVRSSMESQKQHLKEVLGQCAKLVGAKTEARNEYPAWQYNPDSEIRKVMEHTYKEMFGKDPVVSAVHAGLECGLFLGKRPDLDCVSFGPNMYDIHSFNERIDIASTERMWDYLKAVLSKLK